VDLQLKFYPKPTQAIPNPLSVLIQFQWIILNLANFLKEKSYQFCKDEQVERAKNNVLVLSQRVLKPAHANEGEKSKIITKFCRVKYSWLKENVMPSTLLIIHQRKDLRLKTDF